MPAKNIRTVLFCHVGQQSRIQASGRVPRSRFEAEVICRIPIGWRAAADEHIGSRGGQHACAAVPAVPADACVRLLRRERIRSSDSGPGLGAPHRRWNRPAMVGPSKVWLDWKLFFGGADCCVSFRTRQSKNFKPRPSRLVECRNQPAEAIARGRRPGPTQCPTRSPTVRRRSAKRSTPSSRRPRPPTKARPSLPRSE